MRPRGPRRIVVTQACDECPIEREVEAKPAVGKARERWVKGDNSRQPSKRRLTLDDLRALVLATEQFGGDSVVSLHVDRPIHGVPAEYREPDSIVVREVKA